MRISIREQKGLSSELIKKVTLSKDDIALVNTIRNKRCKNVFKGKVLSQW